MQQREDNKSTSRRIDLAAVRCLAEPLVVSHGLCLVDVQWLSGAQGRILRITIDHPDENGDLSGAVPLGGVTLDECVRVSRDVSTALDVEELISQAYNLEVSSPGIDRPLSTARDFRRQIGKLAKIKLTRPAPDGQQVLRGVIKKASDDSAEIEVDGNIHEVALSDIREARLIFELSPSPKKTPGSSGKRRRKSAGMSDDKGRRAQRPQPRSEGATDPPERTDDEHE